MPALQTDLRNKLEHTVIEARDVAETGARAALEILAVHHYEPYPHQTPEQRKLRNRLRAHARQLGDIQNPKGEMAIARLVNECAYEHWHRMLFARFLSENDLLIDPSAGVAISLAEAEELAKEAKLDLWAYASRCAQQMLPQIFRPDDPVLQVSLANEHRVKLERLLAGLAPETFKAEDALGWVYQFWQAKRKEAVNKSGVKIGADELPAVTQLFTEDYMVDFLLDNTIGAWHAGKDLTVNFKLAENAKSEEELRKAVALPGCPWHYLRFIKGEDGRWLPAAGTFDGWPKMAKALKCLDPCMGSGHFVVAMFERLVDLRMEEEKLCEAEAVAAVIRDNLFGLEIDQRCTQIGAFNLALAAWRRIGYCTLPAMNLACSGLAPNAREADWLKIAGDNEQLQRGMERLYQLFQKAPVLGSLINPRAYEGDLLVAAFRELQPLLEKALAQEAKDDSAHEMAVTAHGLAKAAEILAGQFTLVATNVPYLTRQSQCEMLRTYCEQSHGLSKADLATAFLDRISDQLFIGGSAALVSPNNWSYQPAYKHFRKSILSSLEWPFFVRLGPGAFETISGEIVNVSLSAFLQLPSSALLGFSLDMTVQEKVEQKKVALASAGPSPFSAIRQLTNPDHRIILDAGSKHALLNEHALSLTGLRTGDNPHFQRYIWEIPALGSDWIPFQSTPDITIPYGGRALVLFWQGGEGALRRFADLGIASLQGGKAWGQRGVVVSLMTSLPATLYTGEKYDMNIGALWPINAAHLPLLWSFISSDIFSHEVRKIDQQLKLTTATLTKVPFDLEHWQKVAAEKYPHGLPKPHSDDPTQWLFNGHPKGADDPLHVAVARLLGYEWPRQTGSSFPDCLALCSDGLEKLADVDGIACVPSVRGEEPGAERLRKLLQASYGKDWKPRTELELIRATGSDAGDFDGWLRNDFFKQHCDLFHQRPFVWHIWDGRKVDGFHVLVNYHTLAGAEGKGRQTLESLTHSYLGDWITRQKDSEKRGEEGAEGRLAAAMELQKRLIAVLEGEPPFDLFVRWKPLNDQAIGWEPDINDGVRMNIRPFLASELPGGKKGAGILRSKPNIKWDKDRGKEPGRKREEFPWFWGWDEKAVDFMGDTKFDGNRWNDCHYTNEMKRKARKGTP